MDDARIGHAWYWKCRRHTQHGGRIGVSMRPVPTAVAVLAAAFSLLPAQELPQISFIFTKVDQKLLEESKALDRQFDVRGLVFHDATLEKHLTEIALPLLPAGSIEHVEWKFHILRDPMVNAFALPNGSVYVNTGLLARAENDDQIAGILAHEVTHVIWRHAYVFNRSLRKKVVTAEVMSAAASWIPAGSWGTTVAIAINVGQLAILDMVYGFSRQIEEEADRIGAERMERAGRAPAQLVRMFEILDDRLEPEPVPRFFWDHPRLKDRIAHLRGVVGPDRTIEAHDSTAYARWARPAILQNIQLDLDCRRFRSAVAAAQRLVAKYDGDAVAVYWLGESYRSLGPRQPRLGKEELTDGGLRKGYKRTGKLTEEEDNKALAATPEGREMLLVNQQKAEEFLRQSAIIDPSLSDPQFSLGSLYEQQGKVQQAAEAYRKCIELATRPAERRRAEHRLEELMKPAQGGGR